MPAASFIAHTLLLTVAFLIIASSTFALHYDTRDNNHDSSNSSHSLLAHHQRRFTYGHGVTSQPSCPQSVHTRNFEVIQEGGVSQVFINNNVAKNPPADCNNPSVRKEWRTLTPVEKRSWIRAVKCLANLPRSGKLIPTGLPSESPLNIIPPVNTNSSRYDDFAYFHLDINTKVHQTGLFFPWHRYFVWSFEQTLKKHCGYTGSSPYWNWTQDSHNFRNSSIWDPDPDVGLGGFGDPARDHTVFDGAFAGLSLAYPTPHTLRREYRPYPWVNMTSNMFTDPFVSAASTFTPQEVQKLVSSYRGDFKGFQTYFESAEGMHMSVHFIMGGDLSGLCPRRPSWECFSDSTPNEPMFWLHHAMVDKVWSDWQHAHPDNFWSFEGGTVRDLVTWPAYPTGRPPAMTLDVKLPNGGILVGNYTIRDIINTTSNTPLCYTYE